MTNGNDARAQHPEELLAGYVDGSATPEERRTVEAHVAACSQCREEVALASTALTALTSLPQLDGPGLAAESIAGLAREGEAGPDDLAERRRARQDRQLRRWKSSWAALAGVAALLVVLAVVPILLSRGGGSHRTTAGASQAGGLETQAQQYPPVYERGSNYDATSMRALAKQLAAKVGKSFGGAVPAAAPSPSPVAPDTALRVAGGVTPSEVVRCALRGTGLPADTIPVYLETGKYQGTPAYLIAVNARGENRSHLRVYAVSQQGCGFLFEADQPL
jgi:predicted anti-sigma-YlaC factor YlaD